MMGRRKLPYQTLEEWKEFGIERGYDERNPRSLSVRGNNKERSWYNKGKWQGWLKDFSFNKLGKWGDFEQWKIYGIKKGYERRNPTSLTKSDDKEERSWHNKGQREGWIKKFNLKKINGYPWQSAERWIQFGIEHEYQKRNPGSLFKSDDKEERSWYQRGVNKKWLSDFQFKRKIIRNRWFTFEEWRDYGIERSYNKRAQNNLKKSEIQDEKSWFNRGRSKHWTKSFPFTKIFVASILPYKTFEEWKKYGNRRDYSKRSSISFEKSQDKEERSWYKKGRRKKWLQNYKLSRERINSRMIYPSFKEWRDYGVKRGYDLRNVNSFSNSADKEERSWLHKGKREDWLPGFPFKRHRIENNNSQQLETLLELYVSNSL